VKPVPPKISKGEEARLEYWGASGKQPDTLPWSLPGPWTGDRMIVDVHGHDIAMTYGAKDRRHQNAKYIAHACSAYPDLIAALQECNAEVHGTKLGAKIDVLLRDLGERS